MTTIFLPDATNTKFLVEDMYASMTRQNLTTGHCLTHYYVRIVSLLPSSYVHPRKFAVTFFYPHQRAGLRRARVLAAYMTSPRQEF